jgi:hypothetical protein
MREQYRVVTKEENNIINQAIRKDFKVKVSFAICLKDAWGLQEWRQRILGRREGAKRTSYECSWNGQNPRRPVQI